MEENRDQYYESLFLRMLQNDISSGEYSELESWFMESPRNREALTDIYRAHYAMTAAERGKCTDAAGALLRLNDRIRARQKRRRLRLTTGIAASIVLLAGLFIIFDIAGGDDRKQTIAKNDLGVDRVTVVFPDNSTIAFDGDSPIIGDIASDSLMPNGVSGEVIAEAGTMVQLIVPKGKRSSLTLPDGTEMWVNSDSRLSFPSRFGAERKISIDGEIYLKVKRDESKPFVVSTKNFDVTVLGTSFNVRAYDNNDSQSVMLSEGTVKVVAAGEKTGRILVPSQMLTYDEGNISVKTVDTEDHISWITGVYRFRSERLKDIADRLVNYYGTPVVFASDALAAKRFSGKLEFSESADFVYESLARAASLEYVNLGDRVEFREAAR